MYSRLIRISFAVLLMLSSSKTSQGQQSETPSQAYFPTAIGSKWTYGVTGQKSDLVVTAGRNEKIDGVNCTVLESSIDGKIVATEHVAIVGEYVRRFRLSNVDIAPPLPFSRVMLKAGDRWESKFALTLDKKPIESEIRFTVESQKVKVPVGEYDALLVVGKMETSQTSIWFAKGIGPVKMEFDLGQGKRVAMELKSAEIKSSPKEK